MNHSLEALETSLASVTIVFISTLLCLVMFLHDAVVSILSLNDSSLFQAPWSTGTECVAKYNFQTANEQDLPFCKGDVLTIIGVTRVS